MSSSWSNLISKLGELSFNTLVAVTVVYLLMPLAAVVILSLQADPYIGWPPTKLTLKWYTSIPEKLSYLGLLPAITASLRLAVATALVSTMFGTLAAIGIDRYDIKHSTILETFLLSPLIYPWLVIGVAILLLIAKVSSMTGIVIQLSFWTVLIGHVIVTLPYPTRTVLANLSNFDRSLEEAARNLGANQLGVYLRITFPIIRPGLVSGAIFAFVLSWINYILTLFLTSPDFQTVPLLLFTLFKNNPPAQLAAIGTVFMIGIMVLITVAEFTVGISKYL